MSDLAHEPASNRLARRDAAGNRLADGAFSHTYAVNNRLIAVNDALGNPVASYVHNGKGERVSKTVNGVTTFYVYDPSGNLLGEYDASGNAIREYIYGPTGRLATFDMATGQGYWHHNDHLGTPQALTDMYAQVVWEMSQTPFGIATVNEDPDGDGVLVTNNIRFPGQYFDSETGLNYNYFRSYDPRGGDYPQSDPIGLRGGMNTYAYVGGNPINLIDPRGLDSINLMLQGGLGAGFNVGVQIDPSSGDVYVTGGIGVGLGASASATYQVGGPPQEGAAWKFNGTAGNGVAAVQGTAKWDATHYSQTGEHSNSVSGGPKTGGGGSGFGASVSATFSGTKHIGSLGDFWKWFSDTFFDNKGGPCK